VKTHLLIRRSVKNTEVHMAVVAAIQVLSYTELHCLKDIYVDSVTVL